MQRLLYILVYPILWITSILPMWLLYFNSSVLYVFVYYILGYRKKVVLGNLKLVFPEKSAREHKDIAKKFYQHLCDITFETIKSLTVSDVLMNKRYHIENIEVLEELYRENRSVFVVCGHYGNWEWSSFISKKIPCKGYAVYKPLPNPYFDRLVKKIRGQYGCTIISNKKIVPISFRDAKNNIKTLTFIVADQSPKKGSFKHRDTFMNINVPVFTGIEELAKRLNIVIVYLKVKKIKRGFYSASFVPLAKYPSEYKDYEITRMFLDEIEKQIKEEPQYYLWSHKRWKHKEKDSKGY